MPDTTTYEERWVEAVLDNLHALEELQYYGDYDASIILNDFFVALSFAELTERQLECLRLVYVEDLTHSEAGSVLDIGRPRVTLHTHAAIRKIAKVFQEWEELET